MVRWWYDGALRYDHEINSVPIIADVVIKFLFRVFADNEAITEMESVCWKK